ncbi:C-C motif chemokine 19-like [Syngnathoides biaculeatus]|uniref:C-C motif chemokine 19-like n=1 Tax=Syngnathoides biaculeatus TaxID=300417 RepID=UPI002ADD4129|nr:C-C motif chemokine 19-like [Syngnathoides biaculeatus]
MDPRLAALLLVALLCSQPGAGQRLVDCCLSTSNKCFPHRFAASYYHQEAGNGCKYEATVILTKGGRKLCSPPQHASKCVQELIAYLDKRNEVVSAKK